MDVVPGDNYRQTGILAVFAIDRPGHFGYFTRFDPSLCHAAIRSRPTRPRRPAPGKAVLSDAILALEDGALHDLDADKGNLA
jgi:hypothetical protein